jgi:thiamine transport system substrate-binding protein
MKIFIISVLVLFFSVSANGLEIKVLTYDSMVGKKSLGEVMQKEFHLKCSDCRLKYEVTKDLTSLFSKLSRRPAEFDVVLGLDGQEYEWALEKGIVEKGFLFEKSPFAIMANIEKFPQRNWPKSWNDIRKQFQKDLIVQDPRLSQAGLGWLRVLFLMNIAEPKVLNEIVFRSYPSWTASYDQFLNGEARAVWSYLSSEAYHRCSHPQGQSQYLAIPLEEGYPIQEEWVAVVAKSKNISKNKASVEKFLEVALSASIQEKIPLTNWMFPGVEGTRLPDCYQKLSLPWKEWKYTGPKISLEQHKSQLDKWSLL